MTWDPLERLDDSRRQRLDEFAMLLLDFNRRINLISREDEEHVFVHHIIHSLFLTYRPFPSGSTIVDWGTGGGLPAIPLAIAAPDIHVVAVDATEKKVRAVRAMARRLGLTNVEAHRSRAEVFRTEAAYSVSRAAASLSDLWAWHRRLASPLAYGDRLEAPRAPGDHPVSPRVAGETSGWKPGLICLKGGRLAKEIEALSGQADVERIGLSELNPQPYFRDKVMLACTERGVQRTAANPEPRRGAGR